MENINPATSRGESTGKPNSGRRSFMWKIGGAMTAVLASAVPAMSRSKSKDDTSLESKVARLSGRLGMLEEEKAIRDLHKTYETLLDTGRYEEVEHLFTRNAEVIFNGGVFSGRKKGIRRLFRGRFSPGQTGRRMAPAPGFLPGGEQQREMVEVAPDGKSATAKFSYSIQAGAPILSNSSLVQMARLQGEGIRKWWEGGVYELSYTKDARDGAWRIERLEYRTLARADFKPGRSHAKPIAVNPISEVYPRNTAGPDRLIHRHSSSKKEIS